MSLWFSFVLAWEKAVAPHSSTLAWKIPWTEEPGRLQSMGSLESDMTERLHFDFSLSCIGEGNGNPLRCSCLENPRDRGAWWAAVYGVTQSRTRLKRLSSSSRSIVFLYHLSGCSIRAKLASWNELGNVPSSSVSERDCRELHYIILKYSVELFRET